MNDLGDRYFFGDGMNQDYEKAFEWYEKAAEAGSADAMLNLGNMYMYDTGDGVDLDYEKAFEWYEKAVEAGSIHAMSYLGMMYAIGYGVDCDYKKAFEWYKKAANAGDALAMYCLGMMYELGDGVEQEYRKAEEWYQKAADAGDPDAMEAVERIHALANEESEEDASNTSGSELSSNPSEMFSDVSVGETITFGSYEQDNDLSEKEEIEWIVLAKEDNKALLISKYALDGKKYNEEHTSVTWENCTLRTWLNSTFISTAFTREPQSRIQTVIVKNADNLLYGTDGGNDTEDKVFLLSIDEASRCLGSEKGRECVPTDYAIVQGALASDEYSAGGRATCVWWLQSPGHESIDAAFAFNDGSVGKYGIYVNCGANAVRPALWINLDP